MILFVGQVIFGHQGFEWRRCCAGAHSDRPFVEITPVSERARQGRVPLACAGAVPPGCQTHQVSLEWRCILPTPSCCLGLMIILSDNPAACVCAFLLVSRQRSVLYQSAISQRQICAFSQCHWPNAAKIIKYACLGMCQLLRCKDHLSSNLA